MSTPTPAASAANFMVIGNGAALGTGPGNVNQLCMHRTNNTQAEVETAGYYNDIVAAGIAKVGDVIINIYDEDGTDGVTMYLILTGDGVSVDVTLKQCDLA